MSLANHILLAAGWLLYVFLHSLLAALGFKAFVQRIIGDTYFKFYRLAYSFFAGVTLVILLVFQFSMKSILLFNYSLLVLVAGVLFSLIGLIIMAVCIKKYFMNLSGVDVLTKQCRTQVLEKNGLHGYVRHPLYSGTLLFIWSLLLIFPFLNNLIACSIITLYTVIGITIEERKLIIEFGDNYRKYADNIPMLIPSLTRFRRLKRDSFNN